MVAYEGALTYNDLNNMPLLEIISWQKEAMRIQREREKS